MGECAKEAEIGGRVGLGLHLELDKNLISFGSKFIFIELGSGIVWLVSGSNISKTNKIRQISRDSLADSTYFWDEVRRE